MTDGLNFSGGLAASWGRSGTLTLCGSLLHGACGGNSPVPVEGSEAGTGGGPGGSGGAPVSGAKTPNPACPKAHFRQDAGPDTSCVPCPDGWFDAHVNSRSCTPWSVCPEGEDLPGTAEHDRLCRVGDWTTELGSSEDYMMFDVAAHGPECSVAVDENELLL